MSVFLLVFVHFIREARRTLQRDAAFRSLFYAVAFLLAAGTIFYWQVEGWSLIDSLYFSVITLATVGYGDLAPTQTLSKAFTIVYIFVGLGTLLLFINKMADLAVNDSSDRPHILPHLPSRSVRKDGSGEPPDIRTGQS